MVKTRVAWDRPDRSVTRSGVADAESVFRAGGQTGWPGQRGMITPRCGVNVGCHVFYALRHYVATGGRG